MCAPSNNLGLSVSLARNWCKCATYYPIEGENMPAYLSLDIVCSSDLTVFLVLRSRKTVRFSEQIMSAYKYSSTFSCQIQAIVVCLQTWPSASTAYMQYQGTIRGITQNNCSISITGFVSIVVLLCTTE